MDDENTTARESEFCRSRKCEWDSLCCGRSEIGTERTGFPSVWIRSVLQVRGRPHYLRVQTSALTPRCTLDSWQPIATLEWPICRRRIHLTTMETCQGNRIREIFCYA